MFMGEYQHSVDLKGRLIIPSKFREQLGDRMVVTRGLDGCLYIYSPEGWEKFLGKLESLTLLKKADRKFMRFFVAGATECELDKQGRILLPAPLRSAAGIDKDVVLAGMMEIIEVWDKDKWEDNNNYEDMNDVAESMAELGIEI